MKVCKHGIVQSHAASVRKIKQELDVECKKCFCKFTLESGDALYVHTVEQVGCEGAGWKRFFVQCPECRVEIDIDTVAVFDARQK